MREIKFRAWNKDWNEFIYSDTSDFQDKREWYPYSFQIGFSNYPHNHNNTIIEQYTGLKDKNGVDIYEGDILRADNWIHSWIVQWDCKKARFNCIINKEGNQNDFIPSRVVEIIGNIHQNPELCT